MPEEELRQIMDAIEKVKDAANDLLKVEQPLMAAILYTVIGTFLSGEQRLFRELSMIMEAHNQRALNFVENRQASNN